MLSSIAVQQLLVKLFTNFSRRASKEEIESKTELFLEYFSRFDEETFSNAVESVMRSDFSHFPTISEFSKFMHQKSNQSNRLESIKPSLPCYACKVTSNGSWDSCCHPMSRSEYQALEQDPLIIKSIKLYGTRNWKGDRLSIAYKFHHIPLPELDQYRVHNGFKPNIPIKEYLGFRKKNGLDTGPYEMLSDTTSQPPIQNEVVSPIHLNYKDLDHLTTKTTENLSDKTEVLQQKINPNDDKWTGNLKEHPLVKYALDLFEGEIISVELENTITNKRR